MIVSNRINLQSDDVFSFRGSGRKMLDHRPVEAEYKLYVLPL